MVLRYPCFPKKVYTLDPAAPLHAARQEQFETMRLLHISSSTSALGVSGDDSAAHIPKALKPKVFTNHKLAPVRSIVLAGVDPDERYHYSHSWKAMGRMDKGVGPVHFTSYRAKDLAGEMQSILTGSVAIPRARRDDDVNSFDSESMDDVSPSIVFVED